MALNWLFLDLNSYFASVEQAEDPKLQGKPIAVVPMLADTTCCLAASYPAKAHGVKTGTSVYEARQLCPNITFVVANHRKYVAYHHRIIEVVNTCLPVVKVMSVDEMVCELIGREKIEQNAIGIAKKIKNAIYTQISPALTCSIGIAPNGYLAKVASDMQKPDGLTIIHDEDIPQIFFQLRPRDFPGIGAKMEQRFALARCLTVEKLYQLSVAEMRQIWGGVVGERFWHLIRGENLPERPTNRSTIGHSRVLAPQKRNYLDAWPICVELLSKACMRLRQESFCAGELSLSIKFLAKTKADQYWHAKLSFSGNQDTIFFVKQLERLWKQLRQLNNKNNLLKIGVTLSKLSPQNNAQLELFADNKANALMQALDKVNERYKSAKIFVANAKAQTKPGENNKAEPSLSSPIAFQHVPKL